MATVDDAADYIITRADEAGETLSVLKLQKLVYYVQAWHLAFYEAPLFEGKFEAWVHGPVNRPLYERFRDTKSLYSDVGISDVRPGFDPNVLTPPQKSHIEGVVEVYAKFTGTQLEELTHNEEPWIAARNGYPPAARCEVEIEPETMQRYYAARL